jgi:hypothetical protein
MLSLLACLGVEAYGTHHPFFKDSHGGVDDLAGIDVDMTILLIRNPFDTHKSYNVFVEQMRGWGPRTFPKFVRLWETTNLHWAQTEEASSKGRLLILRYEHLLTDPVQALSPLVAAGVSSLHHLQRALRAAAPAFRPYAQHFSGPTPKAWDQLDSKNEGAARNALEGYSQEGVEKVFRRKRQVLQMFGYSLAQPGEVCIQKHGDDTTYTEREEGGLEG